MPDTATGESRKDAYEWVKVLGYGASGKVWLVRLKETGTEYAVKRMVKAECVREPAMLAMVRNERAILTQLDHPNIIKLIECFQTSDELFYVLEKGGSELLEFIKMCHHLELSQLRTIAAEIVSGLEYLHSAGVCHRDLKPENVLLTATNHVKIIDFGTAFQDGVPAETVSSGGKLPRGRTFCGSTHYLSPEVVDGESATAASDLWALGCILYHMATGRRPFEGSMVEIFEKLRSPETHLKFPADCPPAVRNLCSSLLRKDPAQRLGASEGGFQALRAHPLFDGIDFASLPMAELEYQWHPVAAAWVRDCDVTNCRKCAVEFSVTRRKHHCRRCGQIFCAKCSSNKLVVPGLFRDERVRLCDACCRTVQQGSESRSPMGVPESRRSFNDGPQDTLVLDVAVIAGHGQWTKGKAFCEVKLKRVIDGVIREGLHPNAQKVATKAVSVAENGTPRWAQHYRFKDCPAGDAIRVSAFAAHTIGKTKIGQVDLRLAEIVPLLTPGGKPLVDRFPVTLSKEQDGGRTKETGDTEGSSVEVSIRLVSRTSMLPIPEVDVDVVEFEVVRDPPAVLRFFTEGAAIRYTVDGQDVRPPFQKIEFNGSLRLRFPCIKTAAVLPQSKCIEVLAGLRCLAVKAGVEHNIPDALDPAEAAARTTLPRANRKQETAADRAAESDISMPPTPAGGGGEGREQPWSSCAPPSPSSATRGESDDDATECGGTVSGLMVSVSSVHGAADSRADAAAIHADPTPVLQDPPRRGESVGKVGSGGGGDEDCCGNEKDGDD